MLNRDAIEKALQIVKNKPTVVEAYSGDMADADAAGVYAGDANAIIAYGVMPNTNIEDWYFAGWADEIARENEADFFTSENTERFSDADLRVLNEAMKIRLERGEDHKNACDLVNNAYTPGATIADLI
ncbi:hypothetical protein [Nostoc linckia]|nr:hypothetical protein [Nostoc linckia]